MNGILPLWKEKGMTSHDCIFKLRKILGIKKIGHAGTLDPDVEGVLPIAIGKGTKVVEYMMKTEKTYTGEVTLGYSTTTEDLSGATVDQKAVTSKLSSSEVDKKMNEMIGDIVQIPPMYSAVKVKGKKLYEYARNNEYVERPSRIVHVESFNRTSELFYDKQHNTVSFSFKVDCGKGTYVRTLAVDLGEKLGYPSHMSKLTRTKSAGLEKKDAVTLDEVEEAFNNDIFSECLKPIETVFEGFNSYYLSTSEWNKVKDGALLDLKDYENISFPSVFYYNNLAVAVYDIHPNKPNLLKPKKVLRIEM